MTQSLPKNRDELLNALNLMQGQGASEDERRSFAQFVKASRPTVNWRASSVDGLSPTSVEVEKPTLGEKFKEKFVKGLGLGDEGGLLSPLIGAGKGVLSTLGGVSELGQKGLQALTPTFERVSTGEEFEPEIAKIPERFTEPTNIGERIGEFAEQTTEFLLPGLAGLKAGKGAGILAKAGLGALETGGISALQSGQLGKEAAIGAGLGAAFPLAGAALKGLKAAKPTIAALVGKITQGKKVDIKSATKGLGLLDTTGVKSFDDLTKVASGNIASMSTKLDELLGNTKEVFKIKAFESTAKSGKITVERNFVKTALDHLDELYSKTDAIDDLAKIKDLKGKLKIDGLTLKEANNLAREYGIEFGKKAFDKLGQPMTSVNATQFENVRSGVKQAVRRLFKDDATKILDEQMSNLFTVKRLSSQMAEKVNQLVNKIVERGLVERIARKAGRAVDLVTLGAPRGFLTSFLPSNIGNKVMNSLDIQNALGKNLKLLDGILKAGDEEMVGKIGKHIGDFLQKAVIVGATDIEESIP